MEFRLFGTSDIIICVVSFQNGLSWYNDCMLTAMFFFQTSTESEPEGDVAVSQDQETFTEKGEDEGIFCRPLFLLCFLYTSRFPLPLLRSSFLTHFLFNP